MGAIGCLFLLLQDAAKAKDDLKSAISQGNVTAAQAAADELTRLDSGSAVDALLECAGHCKKQEVQSLDRRKDLENDSRRAQEELTRKQSAYRAAMQEYSKQATPANSEKLKKAQEEVTPASLKYTEARKALTEFTTRLRSLSQIRSMILDSLGKFTSDEAVKGMIDLLRSAPDWHVRAGIAAAFERIGREDTLQALVDHLRKEKEPTVKVAVLDSIAGRGQKTDAVVQATIDALQGNDPWQVHAAALEVVLKLKMLEAVEAVIAAMARADGRLLYDFRDTLAALTGVDKGIMPDAWRTWWEQNKESVLAGTYKPRQEEQAGQDGGFTKFFGIEVKSKRAVFVLDRSGSMAQPADFEIPIDTGESKLPEEIAKPKGNRKIDIARWQLKKVLYLMPDGAMFNLIFYGTTLEVYKDRMIKLDKRSREEAFAYIDKLEPSGGTNIFDSLEKGLSFAMGADGKIAKDGADTIYLLSDGMPNQGKFTRPDDIRREIKNINGSLRVAINTILIDAGARVLPRPNPNPPQPPQPPQPPRPPPAASESDEQFMKGLAEENSGKYSAVKRKQ